MGSFIGELGKKLADQWLTLLVLPGVLFLGVLDLSLILRWDHPFDRDLILAHIDSWKGLEIGGPTLVALLVILLLCSAGVGLVAQASGAFVGQLWLAEHWENWPAPAHSLAQLWKNRRTRRWQQARDAYESARAQAGLARARRRIGITSGQSVDLTSPYYRLWRMSPIRPARPTWIGDRAQAASNKLRTNYNLDLAAIWPALTLTFPERAYRRIEAEAEAYQRAATLAGWGILYLIPGVIWAPSVVIPVAVLIAAHRRARVSVDNYFSLVEACVTLYGSELGRALGVASTGSLDSANGREITRALQRRSL